MVGNSDALFEDYPVLAYSITSNNTFKMTDHNENKTEYGVAVNKGENAELITVFNKGLKTKESGKYDEIINKYTTNASGNTEATSILGLIKKSGKLCNWFMEYDCINGCCFIFVNFNRYYLRFNGNQPKQYRSAIAGFLHIDIIPRCSVNCINVLYLL